ncbi:hypothetical protein EIN_134260 [Entamoeba invadens IP1]|uniref:Uncharacterized protein n=1 Tax=Entamoeba invadens IP1 TaxID=370355 RepID=A0A0A1TX94_ENTIV|nr:hypothetical protein EIN_134260 [Entamoeba invadens IP1]ELP85892.1 hypothetical protein EIN_134260 [Entamoeba invadens IP1]|eukprot:XP_004185238.1 hypothetical protein EIN_134260 [Entamoeba invadens IP1]
MSMLNDKDEKRITESKPKRLNKDNNVYLRSSIMSGLLNDEVYNANKGLRSRIPFSDVVDVGQSYFMDHSDNDMFNTDFLIKKKERANRTSDDSGIEIENDQNSVIQDSIIKKREERKDREDNNNDRTRRRKKVKIHLFGDEETKKAKRLHSAKKLRVKSSMEGSSEKEEEDSEIKAGLHTTKGSAPNVGHKDLTIPNCYSGIVGNVESPRPGLSTKGINEIKHF